MMCDSATLLKLLPEIKAKVGYVGIRRSVK